MALEALQNYEMTELDVLLVILRCMPLLLLLCDFFANRIYLPLTVVAGYSFFAYSIWSLSYLIRADVEEIFPMPELNYFFKVEPTWVAWNLPCAIMMTVYFSLRLKYWYIEEGDEVFNFSVWAKQAN